MSGAFLRQGKTAGVDEPTHRAREANAGKTVNEILTAKIRRIKKRPLAAGLPGLGRGREHDMGRGHEQGATERNRIPAAEELLADPRFNQ